MFRSRAVFAVEYKSWDASDVGGLQPRFGYTTNLDLMQGYQCFKLVELR
jgi:hypothetical protein